MQSRAELRAAKRWGGAAALLSAPGTEPARQLQARRQEGLLEAADRDNGAAVDDLAAGDFKKY